MQTHITNKLKEVRIGILMSMLTILFGFGMGGVFGAMEDDLKGYLKSEGKAALTEQYQGDEAKMNAVVSKSWAYFKRAHLHGGAIGAASLAVIAVLAFLSVASIYRAICAACLGLGGFGYSIFWLLSGMRAPGLGGTGAAKESLSWLAQPSAAMLLLGLTAAIVMTAISLFGKTEEKEKEVANAA
ncbi:hypothetical protein V6R21_12435 [Limibacter armeniacum]|uniref:hypothetical protein n=1 Tax=Limibacter armeniacum TaxID=466084 RepID=UPI002FE6A9E7